MHTVFASCRRRSEATGSSRICLEFKHVRRSSERPSLGAASFCPCRARLVPFTLCVINEIGIIATTDARLTPVLFWGGRSMRTLVRCLALTVVCVLVVPGMALAQGAIAGTVKD